MPSLSSLFQVQLRGAIWGTLKHKVITQTLILSACDQRPGPGSLSLSLLSLSPLPLPLPLSLSLSLSLVQSGWKEGWYPAYSIPPTTRVPTVASSVNTYLGNILALCTNWVKGIFHLDPMDMMHAQGSGNPDYFLPSWADNEFASNISGVYPIQAVCPEWRGLKLHLYPPHTHTHTTCATRAPDVSPHGIFSNTRRL